jgi:hypothetical protein
MESWDIRVSSSSGRSPKSPPNTGKPYEARTMTHDIKQNLPHTPDSKVIDRLKIPHFTPHDLNDELCMAIVVVMEWKVKSFPY